MSAWVTPTQFQAGRNKPIITMAGGAELQKALLNLSRKFGDNAVEDILYDALGILNSTAKGIAPSNTTIMRENGIDRLPSKPPPPKKNKSSTAQMKKPMSDKNRKMFLLWVNRIGPGQREIKGAIHIEHGKTNRPKVYCAANYNEAHHIYWIEYGKQGFTKHPYMRPALNSSKRAMRTYIIANMQRLAYGSTYAP